MKDSKLNRRNFLKTSAIGAAGISLLANSKNAFASELIALPNQNSPRQIIPLNHGWLYNEKFTPEAVQPKFNDKSFVVVNIPHTNKMLPLNGFDEQEYCFVSVYRKKFKLPKGIENKRVFIDFGGVMTAAKVYLNGQMIGENKGGYNDFSFELTKNLDFTGENVLAVEVDSTERKDIPPFGNLIDYLTFGGIYRDVQLRIVNAAHIENVFAKPINVLQEDRGVKVEAFVSPLTLLLLNWELTAELIDNGKVISKKSQKIGTANKIKSISPDEKVNIEISLEAILLENLSSIELWDIRAVLGLVYGITATFEPTHSIFFRY